MAGMSLSNSQDCNEQSGRCQSPFLPAQSQKAEPADLQIECEGKKCEIHHLTAETSLQGSRVSRTNGGVFPSHTSGPRDQTGR